MPKTRKRRWVAVLLAVVYPGLGHVYLREWLRALLWFGLVLMSTVLLIPDSALPRSMSVDALRTAGQQLPAGVVVVLLGITVLSMADAYWIATRGDREDAARTCPACGKEVDEDLSFCHWCTERLPERS